MKTVRQRRRFHPYTSRKNMKRAVGKRQTTSGSSAPRSEGLGGMGSQLLNSLLRRAPQGDRG